MTLQPDDDQAADVAALALDDIEQYTQPRVRHDDATEEEYL